MISSIRGTLEGLGNGFAYVSVGGIGLQVHLPVSSLPRLGKVGTTVKLYTHLHLKEDSLVLYGFLSLEELNIFQMLIGVSGVGPRTALVIISALEPERLSRAVDTENIPLLSSIPGIGRKTAGRLVLELKGKLPAAAATEQDLTLERDNADILTALTSLGYSPAEAKAAISSLPSSPEHSLEEKIKLTLQHLAVK